MQIGLIILVLMSDTKTGKPFGLAYLSSAANYRVGHLSKVT